MTINFENKALFIDASAQVVTINHVPQDYEQSAGTAKAVGSVKQLILAIETGTPPISNIETAVAATQISADCRRADTASAIGFREEFLSGDWSSSPTPQEDCISSLARPVQLVGFQGSRQVISVLPEQGDRRLQSTNL
jgi:hypothetical protein